MAAGRWRNQLEAWAIPQDLLDAVPDSPYGWPAKIWKRRNEAASESAPTPTTRIAGELLGENGSLLDVGAGTGRASIPLAIKGHRVTAVERNPGMAKGLREEAARAGVDVTVLEAEWPEAAAAAGRHDVVLCAHVVYDVGDIAPFVSALAEAASVGVTIELTPRHPWYCLAGYYRVLHGLDRPEGPTANELAEVVTEAIGVTPTIERWSRTGGIRFESPDELTEFTRRRLVLPSDRTSELVELLSPDIAHVDGWYMLGAAARDLVTVWWKTPLPL